MMNVEKVLHYQKFDFSRVFNSGDKDELDKVFLIAGCKHIYLQESETMVRNFIISLLVIIALPSHAQIPEDLGINSVLVKGFIELKNGETFEGQFRHNQFLGTVTFNRENETVNVQERNILRLSYKDPISNTLRKFQSFEFKDKQTDQMVEWLFEIIKDFRDFAVLSRTMPASYLGNIGGNDITAAHKNGVAIAQAEIILFVGEELELELYLILLDIQVNQRLIDYSKSKSKIKDRSLIDKYLGKNADKVRSYAKKNHLQFDSKQDLIQLLDYYETIAL